MEQKETVMKKKKFLGTYTVEEIAEAFKRHPYIICRLCRKGKIPAFSATEGGFASGEKFGGQWRFDKQELDNLRKRKNKKGI